MVALVGVAELAPPIRRACRSTGLQIERRAADHLETSAVAVCCCSDSVRSRVFACTSSNSRTFSMAITAWSAKVCSKLDLLVAEGLTSMTAKRDRADALVFAEQRDTQDRAVTHGRRASSCAIGNSSPSAESISCTCTARLFEQGASSGQLRVDRQCIDSVRHRCRDCAL